MTLHVALIEPQVPPNTGNVMRLCAGADVPLHLIGPLGFAVDGQDVQRAAHDCRDKVDLWEHPDWFAFRDAISRDRCIYFTDDARVDYTKAPFKPNSVLVFGNEKDGMPGRIVEKHRARCYRIPTSGEVQRLNLANAVSVVLYEGLRRLGQSGTAPVFEVPEPAEREPNFNVAVPVPALEEEEDEINYNVEQVPRVTPHLSYGPHAGTARGASSRGSSSSRGGAAHKGGPRGGGRPRRGRGGRGKPKRT